ncbi:MAG: dihydropteroate synthase [Treponema sp.]
MTELFLRDKTIRLERGAFVMGIVNATPDSFWDGSRGGIELATRLIEEGADIIDIGGESTRPGSAYVDEAEELMRVVPLVKAIRAFSDVPISVDTRKRAVMEAAFDEGADILNDVSALEDDKTLARFAAEKKIPVVLMHKRGLPQTMQRNTGYTDVFAEVDAYLRARAEFAQNAGIEKRKIIVDPGIGFGKDARGNAELIRRCGELCGGEYAVLMALSRKSCIGHMIGRDTDERLIGTVAAGLISVMQGARILRVHDVKEAVDSLKVLRYIYADADEKQA